MFCSLAAVQYAMYMASTLLLTPTSTPSHQCTLIDVCGLLPAIASRQQPPANGRYHAALLAPIHMRHSPMLLPSPMYPQASRPLRHQKFSCCSQLQISLASPRIAMCTGNHITQASRTWHSSVSGPGNRAFCGKLAEGGQRRLQKRKYT